MSTQHIETPRMILREWKDSDRDHFARINRDPLIMEHLPRILDEKTSNRLVDRFQKHFREYGYGIYAVERKEDGEFVGFAGLENVSFEAPFTPAVEIAWRFDYGYWGLGYGMETGKALLEHAFTALGLKEVVAFTVHDNTRTIDLLERLGMERDPKGDFDYPGFRKDHPLGRFVLYRAKNKKL